MAGGRELSTQLCARICERAFLGYTARQIKSVYPEICISTIRKTIERFLAEPTCISKPRTDRPHALSERQRDHVYDIIHHTNSHIKNRYLLWEVNVACKKCSVQRLCHMLGKRKWLQRKRPELTDRHAQERIT
ncbi:hypothetical protein BJ878DRAFT_142449 [Calycina marina]|uniref:Transposase n=1 Tax=Calycina marina TaxID=1763456 RepID=A0A9P8CF53_9HELO|nr:hypothetical protein BJ878DRAFT_142449 [Calycina marina]